MSYGFALFCVIDPVQHAFGLQLALLGCLSLSVLCDQSHSFDFLKDVEYFLYGVEPFGVSYQAYLFRALRPFGSVSEEF